MNKITVLSEYKVKKFRERVIKDLLKNKVAVEPKEKPKPA